MGFGDKTPALLRCRKNLEAKFERSMRATRQPEQESIPIPIPTPTPIQAMIGLIGHTFLEVAPEGTNLFGRPLPIVFRYTVSADNHFPPTPISYSYSLSLTQHLMIEFHSHPRPREHAPLRC